MRISKRFFVFILLVTLCSFVVVDKAAYADTLNQQTNFNVNPDFDKYKRTSLGATLRHISERAYFYVEDAYWNSLGFSIQNQLINNIKSLGSDFDSNIYPKEIELWGSEPNPGIDGNSKITILIEDTVKNNGGYFESANGYMRQKVANSNEREMIAVSAETTTLDVALTRMFLTHEFQHLISFNQKNLLREINEDVWLNEVRSEYSITHAGYNDNYSESNIKRRASSFFQNPSDSLTEWPNGNIDYGIANMFGEYLVDQFGKEILTETMKKSIVGINSLNSYLQEKGYYERFEDVFMNWMTAAYLNIFSQESRFGYKRPELQTQTVQPQQRVFLSPGFQDYSLVKGIKDWQPVWLEFDISSLSEDPSWSVKIELSGEAGQRFVSAYIPFYNGSPSQLTRLNMTNGKATGYILNSDKNLNKIILFVTKGTKISGFGESETASLLSVKISAVDTKEVLSNVIINGSLIRKRGEKEVYVVWGKYKRYLMPEVISLYGHLNPASAVEVEPDVFNSYITANYVKYVNDEKVYAVWPEGSKHWLNITPQQWDASGRDWGAIFTINDLELNYYKTGVDIIR